MGQAGLLAGGALVATLAPPVAPLITTAMAPEMVVMTTALAPEIVAGGVALGSTASLVTKTVRSLPQVAKTVRNPVVATTKAIEKASSNQRLADSLLSKGNLRFPVASNRSLPIASNRNLPKVANDQQLAQTLFMRQRMVAGEGPSIRYGTTTPVTSAGSVARPRPAGPTVSSVPSTTKSAPKVAKTVSGTVQPPKGSQGPKVKKTSSTRPQSTASSSSSAPATPIEPWRNPLSASTPGPTIPSRARTVTTYEAEGKGVIAGDAGVFESQYWGQPANFTHRRQTNKVYKRDDLIDPNRMDIETGLTNKQLMTRGRAPLGPDGEPINLHHMLQTHDGPIAEVTATFHQQNTQIIHINPVSMPSGINRSVHDSWRKAYWKARSNDF